MKQQTVNYQLSTINCKLQTARGFTLIELLLVIAIIGILAGTLMVGMGNQRQRARAFAALESVNSAMPYLAECYLQNGTVHDPSANTNICTLPNGSSAGTTYPTIGVAGSSTAGCAYISGGGSGSAHSPIVVTCTAGTITCDYSTTANCTKTGF